VYAYRYYNIVRRTSTSERLIRQQYHNSHDPVYCEHFQPFHQMNKSYLVSLPERILRAIAAGIGGFLYEASLLVLPGWLRGTRIYIAIIAGLLRITIELVGGAYGILPPKDISAQELAARKAAGTGIELAGLFTLGWSPLWIFAAIADLTGGTRTYLRLLVSELKNDGRLSEDENINTVEELLDTLENTSGIAAEALDVPPLNVNDMRRTWSDLRKNATSLPDADRLAALYASMQGVSKKEKTSIYALSKSIGAAAMKAGIQTGHIHILDFYIASLQTINAEGLVNYTKRVTLPYRAVAASHLDPMHITYTERLLRRIGIK
jgi:hypothetical protein